ncbi:uncharacterized protein ISCGN_018608 [Ixodes scapularis]
MLQRQEWRNAFQWLPAHCGIRGYEEVERLAAPSKGDDASPTFSVDAWMTPEQAAHKKKKDTVEDKLLKKLRQELRGHRLRASSGDPEDVASQARGPVFAVPALACAEEASARSKEARIKEGETWANNVETRASEPQTGAEARANKVKAWANEAETRAGPPRLKPAWSRLRPGPT